jgi:hypothetical protein
MACPCIAIEIGTRRSFFAAFFLRELFGSIQEGLREVNFAGFGAARMPREALRTPGNR